MKWAAGEIPSLEHLHSPIPNMTISVSSDFPVVTFRRFRNIVDTGREVKDSFQTACFITRLKEEVQVRSGASPHVQLIS